MLLGCMPTGKKRTKGPKPVGADLRRITAEVNAEIDRQTKRRGKNGMTRKAIAIELEIEPSELTRKLQLKGRNRLNVDDVCRLARCLNGPLGWPLLSMDVARRLRLASEDEK